MSRGEAHFTLNLLRWLFAQIETHEYVEFPAAHFVERLFHQCDLLNGKGLFLRRRICCGEMMRGIQMYQMFTSTHHARNGQSQLAIQHRAHKAHETLGFAKFTAAYGLHHDDEDIVDPIVYIGRPQSPLQKQACAGGEILV